MLNTLMDPGASHGHHHTAHHLASMGLKMSPPPMDAPNASTTASPTTASLAAAAAAAMPPEHFQGAAYGHQIPHPGYAARDFLLRREHHEFGGAAAGASVAGDPTAAMLFPTALHHQVLLAACAGPAGRRSRPPRQGPCRASQGCSLPLRSLSGPVNGWIRRIGVCLPDDNRLTEVPEARGRQEAVQQHRGAPRSATRGLLFLSPSPSGRAGPCWACRAPRNPSTRRHGRSHGGRSARSAATAATAGRQRRSAIGGRDTRPSHAVTRDGVVTSLLGPSCHGRHGPSGLISVIETMSSPSAPRNGTTWLMSHRGACPV